MRCAIWYHLHNFKNVKNTHGGVLLLERCIKVTLLHGCLPRFLNSTNGTKPCKTSHYGIVTQKLRSEKSQNI